VADPGAPVPGPHHDRALAWDYENGFYLTSPVQRFGKALAQYELYKRIVELPGSVMEFGVYKGTSLVRLLTFREVLERAISRAVVAFDAFGAFPRVDDGDDRRFIEQFESAGGPGYPRQEIEDYLWAKSFQNFELVEGDVFATLPAYLEANPQTRVALLHLDMDVYEPTKFVLDHLAGRIVAGGVVMVDDYGTVSGATRAVDEFCRDASFRPEKLPMAHIPAFLQF